MDIFLAVLAILFAACGVVGCIVPALPGPPISFIGLLLVAWSNYGDFSTQFLVVWGIITVAVTALDYYLPGLITARFGGSKKAVWGATIGVFAGLFFMPAGLILGPFIGAFIGEMINNGTNSAKAFKVAFGSFVAFAAGTGAKLVTALFMGFYIVKAIFWGA